MTGWLGIVAFHVEVVAYAAAAILFFADLARAQSSARTESWAVRTLVAAVLLQVVHIASALADGSLAPSSLQFALLLCASSMVVVYLALRKRLRIHAIGVVVAPLALALLVGAQFLHGTDPEPSLPGTLLFMHVAANTLGVGFFLLAGAAGAFYLVQERRLKTKRGAAFSGRLPALDVLDLTEHRLLLAGFPLLTFGIVTGAFFAARLGVASGASFARAALTYATWVLVAGVLILRAALGWRGRRAAYGTLLGVLCVLIVIGIYVANSGGRAL